VILILLCHCSRTSRHFVFTTMSLSVAIDEQNAGFITSTNHTGQVRHGQDVDCWQSYQLKLREKAWVHCLTWFRGLSANMAMNRRQRGGRGLKSKSIINSAGCTRGKSVGHWLLWHVTTVYYFRPRSVDLIGGVHINMAFLGTLAS